MLDSSHARQEQDDLRLLLAAAGLIMWMLIFLGVRKMVAQEPFYTRTTVVLFSADALVRTLDAHSTLSNLNNPCQCYKEDGIGFKSAPKQYGYSLGFVAAEYGVAYLLHKRHHDRIAMMIPAFDIVYDGRATVNNWIVGSQPHPKGFSLKQEYYKD